MWGTEQEPLGKPMANIWHGRFPRENTKDDGYYYTAPVGRFPVNGYGIHDMAGNVWEWCSDWYDENYYSNSPVNNPQGPSTGEQRVLRGGSGLFNSFTLRVAYRDVDLPSLTTGDCGFRCVSGF